MIEAIKLMLMICGAIVVSFCALAILGIWIDQRERQKAFQQIKDDWGDEASEKRQDIIGQNGSTGEHYE